MKKLNVKNKLSLSKSAISKFDAEQIVGGATIKCPFTVNCGTSFGLPCITICGLPSVRKCEPTSPTVC